MSNPIFRFAPSPNGELHLGHALSALINDAQARAANGSFILRIEDIDIGRARETFIQGIFTDLAWLGLSWPLPVLHQSTRFNAYRQAAATLGNMKLLYPCFATRNEIKAAADQSRRDPDGSALYPNLHKDLPRDEIIKRQRRGDPYAMRLDMDRAITIAAQLTGNDQFTYRERRSNNTIDIVPADPARWGDAVVMRKDVDASYHLAVVVDDAYQNITHVTRGADLAAATDLHVLLQILLGLNQPIYHHHRLLTDEKGRKLAKSAGDQSIRALREAGESPDDVRQMARVY